VRIHDLYNGKFAVLVIKFFGRLISFNVLKVKPDFVPNMEASRWLAVLIYEFLLLLLYYSYYSLYLILCLA
jgi:hypothetical protein